MPEWPYPLQTSLWHPVADAIQHIHIGSQSLKFILKIFKMYEERYFHIFQGNANILLPDRRIAPYPAGKEKQPLGRGSDGEGQSAFAVAFFIHEFLHNFIKSGKIRL